MVFALFACIALNSVSYSQNAIQLQSLSYRIANGTAEEKRDALYEIRNLRTLEASQIAIPALIDFSEIVRATAAHSIIFLEPNVAINLLIPMLQDKFPFVRREAAYALGALGSSLSVGSLTETLKNEKDFEVRNAAAIALGEIGDASAIEDLTKVLELKVKKKESFLRRSCAVSIGKIAVKYFDVDQSEPSVEDKDQAFENANAVLIKILQNPKETFDTRRESATALGSIGSENSISVLQDSQNSDDLYLVKISKNAINKIHKFNIN